MNARQFRTLNELFLKAVEKHDKPDCFMFKSGAQYRGLSSREALRRVAALAAVLESLGVKRGDRVAIFSDNRVEWALTDYALLGLGAIVVPLYVTLAEPEVEYVLRDSEAVGVVVSTDARLRKVLAVRPRLPQLRFVLTIDCVKASGLETIRWEELVEGAWQEGPARVEWFRARALEADPQHVATIIYTSGTMGHLKGVILTHANIASNVEACLELFPLGPGDVGMSLLPLSHVFERMVDYFYMWQGASIAYAEDYESLARNLLEVRPSIMAVVPRVLERIRDKVMAAVRQSSKLRQKLFRWALGVGYRAIPLRLANRRLPFALHFQHLLADRLVLAKVRARTGGRIKYLISGAAPLSPELARFFHALGLAVYEGYGLTETSPVVSVNYPGHIKLGTAGPPIPGVEVKLGEEAEDPEGRVGREVLVRGPNVTPGYYKLDEENRQSFTEGWFRTGDLGTLDADGYLSITGRKKNLFKTSGGKFISPERLESMCGTNPFISQIMIVGEEREFVGALVVPNFEALELYARQRGIAWQTRDELVARPEIHAFMERQVHEATHGVPRYEKIRSIALVPREFSVATGELSATLKIKRRVVMEKYRHLIEQMYRSR